jgi:hypothetical protein
MPERRANRLDRKQVRGVARRDQGVRPQDRAVSMPRVGRKLLISPDAGRY